MKESDSAMAKGAALGLGVLILLVLVGLGLHRAGAANPPIPKGTVMVGTGNGLFTEFTQDGKVITQLDTTSGASDETGCAFDPLTGDFYTTNFGKNSVSKFDPSGAFIGLFGTGYNADPESIVFDGATPENVYVGQADGTHEILKFDTSGNSLGTFTPTTDQRGTDWIDLSSDRCTMFYTSEGKNVQRFDVCTNTQLTPFNIAPLPGSNAYAHRRLLPSQFGAGGVLVADSGSVERLDATGADVQSYTIPDASVVFALNLDPDGTSFWTGDLGSGFVTKVDIKTGTILQHWNANVASNFRDVAGVCVKGELIAVPTPTPTSLVSPSPVQTPTPIFTPTPRPTATSIIISANVAAAEPSPVAVSGTAGQTVNAGTFILTNTSTSGSESFTTITLGLSKPAIFSAVKLAAAFGGSTSAGSSTSPAASTVITMSPPIVLAAGAKATFTLSGTLSSSTVVMGPNRGGPTQMASAVSRRIGGTGAAPFAMGVGVLMIGLILPGSRKRRLLVFIVLLAALGSQTSCDNSSGNLQLFPFSASSSVMVTGAQGTGPSGTAVMVTGAPVTLGTVTLKQFVRADP
jgi:hypothetical protein